MVHPQPTPPRAATRSYLDVSRAPPAAGARMGGKPGKRLEDQAIAINQRTATVGVVTEMEEKAGRTDAHGLGTTRPQVDRKGRSCGRVQVHAWGLEAGLGLGRSQLCSEPLTPPGAASPPLPPELGLKLRTSWAGFSGFSPGGPQGCPQSTRK